MSKAIVVEDVSMTYTGRSEPVTALKNVTLELAAGAFGSIIGPSGCGKSTLLRLVADIMSPTAGAISIGGLPPSAARREHAIGFVFQAPTLLPWRTLRQNIALPLDIVKGDRKSGRVDVERLIELVGLKGFETHSRTNFPAACNSASRLRGHCCSIPRCYCSTNRSERSTKSRGNA